MGFTRRTYVTCDDRSHVTCDDRSHVTYVTCDDRRAGTRRRRVVTGGGDCHGHYNIEERGLGLLLLLIEAQRRQLVHSPVQLLLLVRVLLVVLVVGAVIGPRAGGGGRRPARGAGGGRGRAWPATPGRPASWRLAGPAGDGLRLGAARHRLGAGGPGPGGHPAPGGGRRHAPGGLAAVLLVSHRHLDGFATEPHLAGHGAEGVLLLRLAAEPYEAVALGSMTGEMGL